MHGYVFVDIYKTFSIVSFMIISFETTETAKIGN
jgi:hypothetical protein